MNNNEEDDPLPPNYSSDGLVLQEGQTLAEAVGQPLFVVPAPDASQQAVLNIDEAIDGIVSDLETIERSITYLKTKIDHIEQVAALNEMQGVIDEALAPYLEELANQFSRLTDV